MTVLAGSLAGLGIVPGVLEAEQVSFVNKVQLAMSSPDGTTVTWDIDGVGGPEFRLTKSGYFSAYTYSSLPYTYSSHWISFGGQAAGNDRVRQQLNYYDVVGPTLAVGSWAGVGTGQSSALFSSLSLGSFVVGYPFALHGFSEGNNRLAFRFKDDLGETHYGWGIINFDTVAGIVSIPHWTYETEPDVTIPVGAPEPSSLALLALGAGGLAVLRRRQLRRAAKAPTP
jgi:hypothetical protein